MLGLLAFVLFRFIFRIVIPVYRASKEMRKKFREFQAGQEPETQQQQGFYPNNNPPRKEPKPNDRDKDYIEFEEIASHH